MSKTKRRKIQPVEQRGYLESLFENKYKHLIFIGLIFVLLSIFFFKLAYQGYTPQAHDTVQWRAAAQVLIEYNDTHRDQALWNSNLFSGMPAFLISYPSRYPFLKNIFDILHKYLLHWGVLYMFLAGLGMYVLMLFLGFKPMIAFIGGISFALSCHFIALIDIGHNTKYRAIVYIPWIMWGVSYLFKHRNILGMGLTALFLIQQFRENHLQITYYTLLMIGIFWIFFFFRFKKEYRMREFIKATLLLAATLIIIGMAVSHPHLSVWDYGKYSIRGGNGLSTEYATSWSFHPLEILTFIIPDFFGGVSPYYWGWMPFTQASMYMGIIILALALISLFNWKELMVRVLATVSLVAIFFSFGKHFPLLSNLLLSYFPFFNRFRVPATILVLIQFGFVVLAGYGLKFIIDKYHENDERFRKAMLKFLIGSIVLLILFIVVTEMGVWRDLPLQRDRDAQYEQRQLEFLKNYRLEALEKSGLRSFVILAIFSLLTYLLVAGKGVKPYLYMLIIAGLTITDLMIINNRHFNNLVPRDRMEQDFSMTRTDSFLLEDEDLFRIFPIMQEFEQSRWAYYHQTIGGYHGAKLRRYQDILDNSLYAELRYRVPFNWNVVRMLNVKYMISPYQVPLRFDNLERVMNDEQQRVVVYKLKDTLPRAWFVEGIETITENRNIFRRLNSPDFNPEVNAITETVLPHIEAPDSSYAAVTYHSLNRIELDVATDKNSFLVLSEVYYPSGWKAYLNGKEIDIHPANYILRGFEIPPGKHTLELVFKPLTHRIASVLSLLGIVITLLLTLGGCYLYYRENYSGEIDYVIKD